MSECPLFIELCAGTAALSLRLHRARARPPVSRMGAKTGYADVLLGLMGLAPGQGARDGTRYLWSEPDPGVRLLLEAYRDAGLARAAADIIRGWAGEDPRALWERLRAEGAPRGAEAGEVARWVNLAGWSQKGSIAAGYYAGPDRGGPCGAHPAGWVGSITSAGLARRAEGLPTLPADIAPDARAINPGPCLPAGTWVFIDPPYQGTTGYGHDLPRSEVVALARRWAEAGAGVMVTEAEAIPELVAEGWHAVEYDHGRVGQRRTFSKQQREVATMSRAPGRVDRLGRQGGLFG